MNKNLLLLALLSIASTYLLVNQIHSKSTIQSLSGYNHQMMNEFLDWQTEFGKKYDGPDQQWYRFTVFVDNQEYIQKINSEQSSFTLAQNQFMDLTSQEFKSTYLRTRFSPPQNTQEIIGKEQIATSLDWRTKGAVSDIKDQGGCGSCWAFSATGALESLIRVLNIKDTRLFSEQDLVDCSGPQGNEGCEGGEMFQAFNYVIQNGIASEEDYEYTGENQDCNKKVSRQKVITKYTNVPKGNVEQLQIALNIQPISVGVDAHKWQFYHKGVFDNCDNNLDHGVLLVGYDEKQNWIIKNSWSVYWGIQGYMSLKKGNTCGVADGALYPQI